MSPTEHRSKSAIGIASVRTIMANTALTGATFGIDGGKQLVYEVTPNDHPYPHRNFSTVDSSRQSPGGVGR